MYLKIVPLSAAVLLLFLYHCSDNPLNTTEPVKTADIRFENLSSEILIDLPTSLSIEQTSSKLLKRTASNTRAYQIYDGIRASIGFADYLINNDTLGIKAMIALWRDTIDWKPITSGVTLSDTCGSFRWTATYDSTADFAYQLIVEKIDSVSNPVIFTIKFNGHNLQPKGEIFYDFGQINNSRHDSLKIKVTFDKQFTSHALHITITGCKMEDSNAPKNIELSLLSKKGIIHISGSSYHPGIINIINGVTGYCYSFIGVIDPIANQSVIKLGLPPSSFDKNTDALFTTYGIAEMWTSAVIEKEIPQLPDTLKRYIASSYVNKITLETLIPKLRSGDSSLLVPANTIDTLTVSQYKQFLELNKSIVNTEIREQIRDLLWINALTQPVYFNFIGYAGNGNIIPAGFSHLNNIGIELDPFIPSKVEALVLKP